MKTTHAEIILALKAEAGTANRDQSTDSYTGSSHFFYAIAVPKRREILKAALRNLSETEMFVLVEQLFLGRSHEEKTMAAMILKHYRGVRLRVTFAQLGDWLGELVGWAEVDALCANVFTADELLTNLKPWQQFICQLAHDENINKRRAALVFLTGPTAHSQDKRLHALAFKLVKKLAPEKEILITKAISWLLRSQADAQKDLVDAYLKKHELTLPKIAVRETRRKLVTGKKNH